MKYSKDKTKIPYPIIIIITIVCLIGQMWWRTPESHLKEGDIVFRGTGIGVAALTLSKWTHCGVVHNENGKWVVVEANQGVQKTPYNKWCKFPYIIKVKRAKGGLSEANQNKVYQKLKTFMGRRYDKSYGWSDEKLYCSELVWKAYNNAGIELSKPRTIKTFLAYKILPKQKRESIIRRKHFIVSDPMVPPCDLVNSNKLRRVF